MSPLLIQWDRIRRRWVLILVIGLVAAAGALGASLLQGTTYTGRAALTIVSQDRAPEQDTVLAQGYADYFNQASSQEVLRQRASVPSSVALNARIAASSPIVYVEATADRPELAQTSATRMAEALRDDVNEGLQGNSQAQIAELTRQLDAARAQNNSDEVGRLQDAITNLQSGTNQLQDLQLNAGVASNSSNAARNAGAALVGGLLLGALLAIALGRFENRIVTSNEVRDRLGLSVLATVGGRRRSGEDARAQLLRSLMGLTNPYGMPTPGALAITGPYTTRASKSRVAVALAGLRALQGQSTLLLQTDLEAEPLPSELATMSGVADFLAERGGSRVDGKIFTNGRALLVAPQGSKRDDLFALFSKTHVQRLVTQGTALADLVIIDAPPVESVEGQVVCTVADRALLVIEEGETRAKDATSALDALGRTGSTALGVVLVRNPNQMVDPGFLSERNWNPVRLPAGPPTGRPLPAAAPVGAGAPAGPGPRPGSEAVPPADRTAPISAKKLEEAREALNRDGSGTTTGAAGAAVAAAAAGTAAGAAAPAGQNGTNGSHRPVNGTASPAGEPKRRDDKPAAGSAPTGRPGTGPEKGDPSPAARPNPAGPGRSPSPSPAAGQGQAQSSQAPVGQCGPAKGQGGQGGKPGLDAALSPAARVVRRTGETGGKPSPQPKPGGEPPNGDTRQPGGAQPGGAQPGGAQPGGSESLGGSAQPGPPKPAKPAEASDGPGPSAAKPSGPVGGQPAKPGPGGPGAASAPHAGPAGGPAGGPPARPTPKPTPSAPSPSGSASKPSAKPSSPGSPAGAKRIGVARFTSRAGNGAGASAPSGDKAGAKEEASARRSDSLSAPTVTMRTEK
ncbi:hypothetical protein PHK61_20555 [Actinomycetospora lutea]|uniref:hypothetical protein n=1 Tax=Actinomycetospora lutea TaxID=663604 RepID=UPI0023657ADB|nr:hypothetical protein [Actinomycetospora lutea]MDD7940817.1 hypothetical protein [Actinomycetospora lutea]